MAWTPLGHGWVSYIHTYVSATCTAPSFENSGEQPVVHWMLSEPAPGSYWAVERAEVGGEFAEVARVKAGADSELVWTDATAPPETPLRYRIRRESVDARYRWWSPEALWEGATTGVRVSFGGATADAGHVRLVWQIMGERLESLTLERRTAETPWQEIATLTPDGTGRVIYEDADVVAGGRYGYRLSNAETGFVSDVAWVDIPSAYRLWLAGFRPNPTGGSGKLLFSLPDGSPAKLEVFDVNGRRVISQEVGDLGPGPHQLDLRGRDMQPGVYLLRLTQGGTAITARGVIIQ